MYTTRIVTFRVRCGREKTRNLKYAVRSEFGARAAAHLTRSTDGSKREGCVLHFQIQGDGSSPGNYTPATCRRTVGGGIAAYGMLVRSSSFPQDGPQNAACACFSQFFFCVAVCLQTLALLVLSYIFDSIVRLVSSVVGCYVLPFK